MKVNINAAIAVGAALWVCGGAAQGGVIDSFTGTQTGGNNVLSRTSVGTTSTQETTFVGILGNQRTTRLTGEIFVDPGVDIVQAGIFPAAGVLDYASSAGAEGKLTLLYPNPPGDLNADFSADSVFRVRLTEYDFPTGKPINIRVTLEDGSDQPGRSQTVNAPGAQNVIFPFNMFPAGLNFSDIQSIAVEFFPGQATDFRVDEISTRVPEPTGLTIMLCASGAWAVRRKKRMRQMTS